MEHNRGRGSLTRRYLAALPAPAVVDITARKKTVEALNDSRRYLQALFDNSLDGILVTNDEARYIDANPAACALLGYTHEELMQLNILDLTAVPFREKGWARWQEFLTKGSQSGEYSTLRKDGTVIQLEFRAVANILPGIHVSASRDVTERKRAEQAQREAERKYRDIFENALEGIFRTSPEGRFMVANPALASMFGFDSPEELIRERADISKQHYVDPKRREEFIRLLEVEGIVHHFDYEAYRKDGSKIWVSANVRAVRDGKGRVLCYEGIAKEITEHKRAKEALHESEERYRELFENAKDATYVHDLSGRYISVNRAAEKLSGRSRDEIVGKRFTDFVPPDQIEVVSEHLCQKLAEEGETTYETELLTLDGRRVPIEVSSHLIYQDGAGVGVQGTARDITERRRAEELLRIKERRFRALIENSSDAIALFSPNGKILYASPSTPTVIGFRPEQLLGFSFFELIHPEDQKVFKARFATFLEHPRMRLNHEARVRHKDGSWRWLEGTFTNLLEEPDIGAIVNNYRDITERKRAEDDLRQQKEILQKIFDHIPVMIRLTGPDGKVQLVNREYERTTGWTLTEIQDNNTNVFAELYPDMHQRQVILDRIATPKGEWADFRTRVRDGRVIDTSWTNIHLSAGMNLGIGQDISDRKRAEETLRGYSRQLIEAQEAERQHIARELHDQIGQVLTAIRINLQTIRNSCETEESRSLIDQGMGIIDAALEQVRNLSFELRPSLLDDLGLVAALRWYSDQYTQRTGIRTRSVSALPGGQTRLREELETACFRIVQEALTNVVRHANAKNVSIDLRKLDHKIVLSIKDDGIGFKERAPDGDASAIRLGLRGMRERALAVGGTLEIESAPARGTEIRAYLPTESKGE